MNKVDNLIIMLHEFYYKKNGKDSTINFLKYIIEMLEETTEDDWK